MLLLYELLQMVRSLLATRWAQCRGQLLHWDMDVEGDGEATMLSIRNLVYSYSVDGEEHTGNRIGFGFPRVSDVLYTGPLTDEIFASSPELTVFYSEDDPSQSSLCVGLKAFHILKIIGYSFCLLMVLRFANDT